MIAMDSMTIVQYAICTQHGNPLLWLPTQKKQGFGLPHTPTKITIYINGLLSGWTLRVLPQMHNYIHHLTKNPTRTHGKWTIQSFAIVKQKDAHINCMHIERALAPQIEVESLQKNAHHRSTWTRMKTQIAGIQVSSCHQKHILTKSRAICADI